MAKKLGEDFARGQVYRGFRELGGVLYGESNVAQPMYPPHHDGYVASKESEPVKDSVLDQYPEQADVGRDDPGLDDPGIERE